MKVRIRGITKILKHQKLILCLTYFFNKKYSITLKHQICLNMQEHSLHLEYIISLGNWQSWKENPIILHKKDQELNRYYKVVVLIDILYKLVPSHSQTNKNLLWVLVKSFLKSNV